MRISKNLLRNYLVTRRSFILLAGKLSMLSMLSLRMLYIQIIDGTKYKTLSDKNRINVIMLPPVRGKITDINGKIIADNSNVFKVMLDKMENPKYQDAIKSLAGILSMKQFEIEVLQAKAKKIYSRYPGVIMDNLSWEQVSIIEENIASLKGIYIEVGQARIYNYKNILSHPVGYIANLSEKDKKQLGISNILNIEVGKHGIEKLYEDHLRGEFGIREAEVNAHGQIIREISHRPSMPGTDLNLNLDVDLQQFAMKLLPQKGGSITLLDLKEGKILVSASSPGYDPSEFSGGLSSKYWKKLINDPYKPLINKVIQNKYPPGSIFKMVVVLAALEAGLDPLEKVNCTSGGALGGKHFKCWYRPGHGMLNLGQAIKRSCNAYMYHIAKEIGGDKIAQTARKFGFGEITGIDLPGESGGFLPSSSWKMNRFKQKWRLGDSLNTSIGQGFVLVTHMQITRFCAAIATGKLISPRIFGRGEMKDVDIDPDHLNFIKSAMYDAVNQPGGTAFFSRIQNPKWIMAGKTSTSQVRSKIKGENLSLNTVPWQNRNHGIFTAYAPFDNPRFVTTILVDHGGGGSRACAPLAKKILVAACKKYL